MDKNLSWFIGPKAENASTFEDLLNVMVNDCFHWRKNYFPDDPLLITKSEQHVFDEENDTIVRDKDRCLRCSICYQTCPFSVIKYFIAKFSLEDDRIIHTTVKASNLNEEILME